MKAKSASGTSNPSKLTLRLESVLIKRAKRYARERGTSLSKIIADYFYAITAGSAVSERDWKEDLPPTTRSLVGLAAGSELNEEDYHRHLEAKHR